MLTEKEELELLELENENALAAQEPEPQAPEPEKNVYWKSGEIAEKGSRPWLESEITKHRGELKENPSLAPIVKIGGDVARSAGYTFGKVFEPLTKPIMSTIGKAIPEPIKKFAGETATSATEAYRDIIPDEGTRDVISSVGAMGVTALGLKDIGLLPKKPKVLSMDKELREGVEKGIAPTVTGKKTLKGREGFYDDTRTAVEKISENKNKITILDENGNQVDTPKTLSQFAQAIDQTKKIIYKQYNDMAIQAGDNNSLFKSSDIVNKLEKLTDPDGFYKGNTSAQAYASSLLNDIRQLEGAPPDIIQERIRELNESLAPYYSGRAEKVKARIDASVAEAMRTQLDKQITDAVGEGYQELKDSYGALKAIEQSVNKAALKKARQAKAGLFDLTDVFTGGEIVSGVITLNPALIAKGASGMAIKNGLKILKDPDRYIAKMFNKAYKISDLKPVKTMPLTQNETITPEIEPDFETPTYLRKGRTPLPEQPLETEWKKPTFQETPTSAKMMQLLEDFNKKKPEGAPIEGIDYMSRDAAGDLAQQVTEKKKLPVMLPLSTNLISNDIKKEVSKFIKEKKPEEPQGSGFIKSIKDDVTIDSFNKWFTGLSPTEKTDFMKRLGKKYPEKTKDDILTSKELANKRVPSSLMTQEELSKLRWSK